MERNTLQNSPRPVPARLHPRGRACPLFLKLPPSRNGFGPGYCPCIHITSWDHTHTSLLVHPVSIHCQETLHIIYNVHKTTSIEIGHKRRWKIHIYFHSLEWNGHKWSLKTKETRLKLRRTRQQGSYPFQCGGQADVLGRYDQEERVSDLWCCHSYKASCSLLSATLPFFRVRAVKNYTTCYVFLSNPVPALHTAFSVSAAILIFLPVNLWSIFAFSSECLPSWLRKLVPAFPEMCLLLHLANPLLTSSNCAYNLLHLTFSFGLKALYVEGESVPASGKARYQQGTGLRRSEMCISSWLSVSSA